MASNTAVSAILIASWNSRNDRDPSPLASAALIASCQALICKGEMESWENLGSQFYHSFVNYSQSTHVRHAISLAKIFQWQFQFLQHQFNSSMLPLKVWMVQPKFNESLLDPKAKWFTNHILDQLNDVAKELLKASIICRIKIKSPKLLTKSINSR